MHLFNSFDKFSLDESDWIEMLKIVQTYLQIDSFLDEVKKLEIIKNFR